MPDLALVVFENGKKAGGGSPLVRCGLSKLYFGMALYRLFHAGKLKNGIRVIQPDDSAGVVSIKLPFAGSQLERYNQKYLARHISQVCSEYGCVRCFFPRAAIWTESFPQYRTGTDMRTMIYKGLLIPVLREIYVKSGIRLDSLDIAFVCADDLKELLAMVKQLEPFVKFVSIAAPDKKRLESDLADICADSGLSVFVGSDYGGILRNADLVINFGDTDILSKYRTRPHTLVVSFGSETDRVPRGDYPVIHGVEVGFPHDKMASFGEDILSSYSKAELAEILLALKAGLLFTDECGNPVSDAVTSAVADAFNGCGCHIAGFAGRRGILSPDELRKSAGIRS